MGLIFFASFVRVFLVKMRIVALSIPILAAEISEEQSMEVEALQSIYATEFESMCCGYFERLFCSSCASFCKGQGCSSWIE